MISKTANLSIEFLFELFYNLANETPEKNNLTILTDYFTFYKIVTELMFPVLIERNGTSMKEEYINEILNYVNAQDEQLIQRLAELSRIVDKAKLIYILAFVGKLFGSR